MVNEVNPVSPVEEITRLNKQTVEFRAADGSADIYKLDKFASVSGKLKVKQGGKITLINLTKIAFTFSENKIVYIVKIDGSSIITNLTLNEMEDEVSKQIFF
jgi:DNA-binding LytR/AlgR family response regulator